LGGLWTLFAESAQARSEWKQKLEEASGLRKVVQESNKVFEVETLSADTFLVPSVLPGAATQAWSHENAYTGKVTCSVPFSASGLLSHSLNGTYSTEQIQQMDVAWLQLAAQRVYGSVSDMIPDVSAYHSQRNTVFQ
jgi:hypothetical protein